MRCTPQIETPQKTTEAAKRVFAVRLMVLEWLCEALMGGFRGGTRARGDEDEEPAGVARDALVACWCAWLRVDSTASGCRCAARG